MEVEFNLRDTGWYWIAGEFSDGPFDTKKNAWLDCQAFVEYELDEMTEIDIEVKNE